MHKSFIWGIILLHNFSFLKMQKVLLLIFIVCISLCANNVFAAPKFTSKFFIIKDVGDVPNITVSYQAEDDYTKVILSSSNFR